MNLNTTALQERANRWRELSAAVAARERTSYGWLGVRGLRLLPGAPCSNSGPHRELFQAAELERDADDWLGSRTVQIGMDAPRSFSGVHSNAIPILIEYKGLQRQTLVEQCSRVLVSFMLRVRLRQSGIDYTQVLSLTLTRLSVSDGLIGYDRNPSRV